MFGSRLVQELQMNTNNCKNILSDQVSTYNKSMNNVLNMQIRTWNKIMYKTQYVDWKGMCNTS